MDIDEAISVVNAKARGRTRFEGQKPFIDEVLVAEIERLRKGIFAARHLLMAANAPWGGPTSWRKTTDRWFDEFKRDAWLWEKQVADVRRNTEGPP
jgi:hypothetical protein